MPKRDYATVGRDIGELVNAKQEAYGDSFTKTGHIMKILYPAGIQLAGLDEALTVVRVLDKLNRVATAQGSQDPMGESPWRDVAGYALLEVGKQPTKETEQ